MEYTGILYWGCSGRGFKFCRFDHFSFKWLLIDDELGQSRETLQKSPHDNYLRAFAVINADQFAARWSRTALINSTAVVSFWTQLSIIDIRLSIVPCRKPTSLIACLHAIITFWTGLGCWWFRHACVIWRYNRQCSHSSYDRDCCTADVADQCRRFDDARIHG